jgi:hypothetical protein
MEISREIANKFVVTIICKLSTWNQVVCINSIYSHYLEWISLRGSRYKERGCIRDLSAMTTPIIISNIQIREYYGDSDGDDSNDSSSYTQDYISYKRDGVDETLEYYDDQYDKGTNYKLIPSARTIVEDRHYRVCMHWQIGYTIYIHRQKEISGCKL